MVLAIEAEILSNLLVEGDSAVVMYWVNKKERSSWRIDGWPHQICDVVLEFGCLFCWIPWAAT